MPEELKQLIREYQEGKISRREFMRQAVILTGSLAAAGSLIGDLAPAAAYAAQVAPDDPEILTHNVEYKGKAGPVFAYLARPVKAGKYPALIVIHDNRGLNDHNRDIARRLAKEEYVVLLPDLFSRHGGTMKLDPKGEGVRNLREVAPQQNVIEDTQAGFAYLKVLPDARSDRQGLVGFCWGGGMVFAAATQIPTLDAAVVYYGESPDPLDLVKNIRAPILAHYGEKDPRITNGVPDTEAAMKKYNKSYTYKIYPGAQHAFNNDTRSDSYHPEAAKEAWAMTLEFFKKHLKGDAA
jgi:carboxymethylenebutenolidase